MIIVAAFIFLSLFTLANYYIGLKGYHYLVGLIPLDTTIYWVIFGLIAFSFILGRLNNKIIPAFIKNIFNHVGSFWIAIMIYALLIFLIFDIASFIIVHSGLTDLMGLHMQKFSLYGETLALLCIIGTVLYGTYYAKNIKINSYDIIIPKKSDQVKNLNIVFLSDTHLGNIVNNKRLEHIVDKINSLSPDIVLWGGDIIDDNITAYVKENMSVTLKRIKSTYGMYAVLGNHDGTFHQQTEVVNNLENGGIKVLLDEYVKINESFYLVGRINNHMPRGGLHRKPLGAILEGIDTSCPIILLDHSPANFEEAKEQNVDLQLSGHTHAGQFFPNTLITKIIFERDWGYLRKENFQLIVSSGAATWGPPLRIGSDSEIVNITISFEKQ